MRMYQELAFLILYKRSLKLQKEVIKNRKSIKRRTRQSDKQWWTKHSKER